MTKFNQLDIEEFTYIETFLRLLALLTLLLCLTKWKEGNSPNKKKKVYNSLIVTGYRNRIAFLIWWLMQFFIIIEILLGL